MPVSRVGRAARWITMTMAVALALVGCARSGNESGGGGDGREGPGSDWQPGMINIAEAGEPKAGGELVFAGLAEPRSLDPAMTITSGLTGGIEMGAIYDFLMRWDSEKGELEPQLAESLEANDDHTQWTLKLRPEVTFSNGKPLDADAVVWSIARYMKMPTDESRMWAARVSDTKVVDAQTVQFTLTKPWPTFGYMLTTAPGMIVGQGSDGANPQDFTPIGAGPYVVEKFAPGEGITLKARDDHWKGKPKIETIRTVYLGAPTTTAESYDGGSVDMVALNSPDVLEKYLTQEQMFLNMVPIGRVVIMNASKGRPGEDERVRRAMALAIDPDVVKDRVFKGAGFASDELFPEFSTWHSGVEGPGHDPEEAKKLLEEAKADGYDGKVTYSFPGTPAGREQALAIKAQLDAVGFDTELDALRGTPELIQKVLIDTDYDISQSGLSWREAEPWARMAAVNHSTGNPSGTRTSPELDALIDEFGTEADHDKKVEIAGRIQEQWNKDLPAIVLGPATDAIMWSGKVHGVKSHINAMVILDEAWVD